MVEEIKTIEARKEALLKKGKENGYITLQRIGADKNTNKGNWAIPATIETDDFIKIYNQLGTTDRETLMQTIGEQGSGAEKLQDNIRQIEGIIKKMGAKSFLSGVPISLDTAREAVSELITGNEPVHVTIEKILSTVSTKYNVSIEDLKGRRRTKDIAKARHIAIYLIKQMTDIPLTNIARVFERDHTTIMSSVEVIEREIRENPSTELEISELKKEMK